MKVQYEKTRIKIVSEPLQPPPVFPKPSVIHPTIVCNRRSAGGVPALAGVTARSGAGAHRQRMRHRRNLTRPRSSEGAEKRLETMDSIEVPCAQCGEYLAVEVSSAGLFVTAPHDCVRLDVEVQAHDDLIAMINDLAEVTA